MKETSNEPLNANERHPDPEPAPQSPVGVDLNVGKGGSYVRDPITRQRRLVQRTAPCVDCRNK